MKLVVIIPCLNEEKTIARVVADVPRELPGIRGTEVIVIDDGSTDGTADAARGAGADVVSHLRNKGLGHAFRTGTEAALERGADIVVNLDGDGQFNAADVARLVEPIVNHQADFVTASRFKDAALIPKMPPVKKWGNHRMSQLISVLTGQRFFDVSCGFRAYTREALLNLTLMGGFTYTQETFLEMVFKGFNILELPVAVRGEREFGKSRMASSIWNYAKNTAKIILRSYRDYKPFQFFAVPAALLMVAGAGLLGFLLLHYVRTGQFSGHLWAGFTGGALAFTGLLMLLIAVVTDMLVRLRRNQERLLYYERSRRFDLAANAEGGEAPQDEAGK